MYCHKLCVVYNSYLEVDDLEETLCCLQHGHPARVPFRLGIRRVQINRIGTKFFPKRLITTRLASKNKHKIRTTWSKASSIWRKCLLVIHRELRHPRKGKGPHSSIETLRVETANGWDGKTSSSLSDRNIYALTPLQLFLITHRRQKC